MGLQKLTLGKNVLRKTISRIAKNQYIKGNYAFRERGHVFTIAPRHIQS